MKSKMTSYRVAFRPYCLLLLFLFLATSCFKTEMYEPQFEDNTAFHGLKIPAEGYAYDVPFEILCTVTRTSVSSMYYQMRGRLLIDGVAGEVYDTASALDSTIWWRPVGDSDHMKTNALMHVQIPSNESAVARTVAVQISIDEIAHYTIMISEEDEHQWGEWTTILDGTQAGYK